MVGLCLCGAGAAGSAAADPLDVATQGYVRDHWRALSWPDVLRIPERVVYIGETHQYAGVKDALAQDMSDIRAGGITHLALELWGDDQQPLLDRYSRGEADDAALVAGLKSTLGEQYAELTRRFGPDYFQNYIRLMRAARGAGLKLVALDMPYQDKLELDKICGVPSPPAQCAGRRSPYLADRDIRMSSNLSGVLSADPGARVLALVGSDHADRAGQPAALLKYGWTSKTYLFSDGIDNYAFALRDAHPDGALVFVDASSPGAPPFDIHFDGDRTVYDGAVFINHFGR
ncbi:MAG: ChaN family lipoprotein [Vulcanimicrobiaceae bacterium]